MSNQILYIKTVLFQTTHFSISLVFVYTQLNVKTVLFQTIPFSKSTQFKSKNSSISNNSVYHKYSLVLFDPIRCYHFEPDWTWELWQWRGTPYSQKLKHYGNLNIRLFSVISSILVEGVLPLGREAVSVFYSPQMTVQSTLAIILIKYSYQMWIAYTHLYGFK